MDLRSGSGPAVILRLLICRRHTDVPLDCSAAGGPQKRVETFGARPHALHAYRCSLHAIFGSARRIIPLRRRRWQR
jgi:hypothetical protein